MAAGDTSDKTEKPTPKRLKEARERGQMAKTPELTAWVSLLATTVLLQITIKRGSSSMQTLLARMGRVISNPDMGEATKFAHDGAMAAVSVVAPMLIGMMVVSFIVAVSQVGFRPTGKKLKPDFKRLNPFKGFKRMVGFSGWWELIKALVKTGVLAAVGLPVFQGAIHNLTGTQRGASMWVIAGVTAHTALTLLRNISAAGLVLAAADYVVQKRRVMKQLRMTRQEVREEMKSQEGNPEMRRAIRSRAMSISRNRMIRSVSMADVVTVNPTHYAVALKYDPAKGAPQVLAKGAGVVAAAIRAQAEQHGVPIVREPLLTRTLYKACEVGQLIPTDLYEAVAQLLAFVFALRSKGRARGFHELPSGSLL